MRHTSGRHRHISKAVAAIAVLGVIAAACGDDDDGGDGTAGDAAAADGDAAGGGDDDAGAGADGAGPSLDGESVTMWIMDNGPDPQQDAEDLVAPFEEETGVDVNVVVVGWENQFEEIRNAAVTGDGPDITQAGTTQVPFFATLGGFEDLSDRIGDLGGADAYSDGVWATTHIAGNDDEIWAMPWFTEARAIYYRTDVLDAAGIDPDGAFADWDAFRSTLEAIADLGEIDGEPIEPFGSPGRQAWDLVHHVMPFVWSAGGAELNDDATEATIDSSEAQEGIMFFGDLLADGLYAASELERDGTQVENQFKAGRIATWMGGPWTYASSFRDDDENWTDTARANVGIAPMPAGPDGDAYTFVGGSNLMMFEASDSKDAAWELMKFLSRPEVQLSYAELLGMFPSVREAQEQQAQAGENEAAFFEAIEQGRTYAAIPHWGQIEAAYRSRFANILEMAAGVGSATYGPDAVAAELEAAADEADALLAQDPE